MFSRTRKYSLQVFRDLESIGVVSDGSGLRSEHPERGLLQHNFPAQSVRLCARQALPCRPDEVGRLQDPPRPGVPASLRHHDMIWMGIPQ